MKALGFWCLLLLILAAASVKPGVVSVGGDVLRPTVKSRDLEFVQDNTDDPRSSEQAGDTGNVSFEDYSPVDPVPTSKTSVRHGPIQHDSPLMPYIPKPSPPPNSPELDG